MYYICYIVYSYAKQQEYQVTAYKTEIDELKKINKDLRGNISDKDSEIRKLECKLAALRLIAWH